MAENIRRVEYYYVTVTDKPGSGAAVLDTVREAGVNLLAYLGFPAGRGMSQIDLVPEDPAVFKSAAQRAGLKLSRAKRAFLVDGDDRIDKATLGVAGRNKDIEIRLSQTKGRTVLRFDTLTSERGSLFAKDIDNDGDKDEEDRLRGGGDEIRHVREEVLIREVLEDKRAGCSEIDPLSRVEVRGIDDREVKELGIDYRGYRRT